ncbi:MAG: hypothetical protein AB7F59_07745 [Bdellovibrionales bacterium]
MFKNMIISCLLAVPCFSFGHEVNQKRYTELRALFYNSELVTTPSKDINHTNWNCEFVYETTPLFNNLSRAGYKLPLAFHEFKHLQETETPFLFSILWKGMKLNISGTMSADVRETYLVAEGFGLISSETFGSVLVIRKLNDRRLILEEMLSSTHQFYNDRGTRSGHAVDYQAASYGVCDKL